MHVHWLADRDHGETETTVFNVTEFPPNRWHELHRHPHAEEYFYVLEGEGLHLTDGEPIRLRKGDLVFIPKGEWHGFANDSNDPTLAITVMGGVAHYSDAGYEVHTCPRANEETAILLIEPTDTVNTGDRKHDNQAEATAPAADTPTPLRQAVDACSRFRPAKASFRL